jgi:minor extracellular serine protease Vpr
MGRSRSVIATAVSASAVFSAVIMSTPATGTPAATSAEGSARQVSELPLTGPDGERSGFLPAALDPDRLTTVMLEVAGEPVAAAQADAAEAGGDLSDSSRAALRAGLRDRQAPIRQGVEALDGRVLSAMQDAYNGIKARVPRSALAELSALPGVVAVHPVPTYERTNADSVPFLGVPPEVWEDLGLTGQGVSIGIIDTGIDYTHADFGGEGTTGAYEANDPTVVEDGTFPTAKVVGGVDFVGDAYNPDVPDDPAAIPAPDPDPLDCNGHGTHVAGTAAGMGVLADGSTFRGPYDSSTHEQDFTVGPGVAPQASLYALKVFGCAGGTQVVVEAVDWAVAHDLDVINLSLGSPFSTLGDADVAAIDNAARAGVVPVLSAGNEGDISYITGAPGTAERAISVAAIDTVESLPRASLAAGGTQMDLQVSNGVDVPESLSGPLVVLQDDPTTAEDDSLGCAADDYAGVRDGAVVVAFRGICPRVDRAVLGQAAGAVAVVLVNDAPGLPPVEGPIAGVTVPFLGATPEQGEQLAALAGQVATISDADPVPNPGFRRPAEFTSAGPALVADAAKPDLAAPGVSIVSAAVGTGSDGVSASGTSMAAPHVAGVAALVREARPRLRVPALKAAIINTADPAGTADYSTLRLGAGLVDPDEAVRTPVVALGDRGTASLSFGFVESAGTVTERRTVTLRNLDPDPVAFAVSVEPSSSPPGASDVSVRPRSVTVPARGEVEVTVTVTVTPSTELPPDGLQSASGTVAFTPADPSRAVTLRVPYVLVHRATSDLRTRPDDVRVPGDGTAELTTRNASRVPGTADVYAWGFRDARGDDVIRDGQAPDIRAVGVQAFADLAPFPDDPGARGVGVFAVNTHRRVGNASAAEYAVLVDVTEDGTAEYAVIGLDLGLLTVDAYTGQFAAVTFDLTSGEAVRALAADGAVNSGTVTLPFVLSDMGLGPANPDFLYDAETFSTIAGGVDEVDGRAAFDAFDQPVETGQLFEVPGRAAVDWTAAVDGEQLRVTPVLGWMVVQRQDPAGADQAELIRLRGGRP